VLKSNHSPIYIFVYTDMVGIIFVTYEVGTAYHSGAHEFTNPPPPPLFKCTCISGVSVVHFVKLHVFTFLVPCCDVRYVFCVKTMFGSFYSHLICRGFHVLFMLVVFLRILVSNTVSITDNVCVVYLMNSNTTGITSGAATAITSGHLCSPSDFSRIRVARSLVFCVMFCRSFVFLSFSSGHCIVSPSLVYGF